MRRTIADRARSLVALPMIVLIVCGMFWYLASNPGLLALLRDADLSVVCGLVALRMLLLVINGLFLRAFASKFRVHLVFKEWFGLSAMTSLGNYITPLSGGLVARAVYLRQRHGLSYAQFAALLTSNYLVIFGVVGILGVVTTLSLESNLPGRWIVASFFGGTTVLISVLVTLPVRRLPWTGFVGRSMNSAVEGWSLIRNDRALLRQLVAYTLCHILLNSLSFWWAYRSIGHMLSFAAALLTSLMTAFSILISLAPANLGVQEAVISFSAELLGFGVGSGFVVALLIRAATLVVAFTLGPLFSFLLTRELSTHTPNSGGQALDGADAEGGTSDGSL